MSDKTLAWVGIIIGLASLYINVRMASALQKVSNDVDRTTTNIKSGNIAGLVQDWL